jgi:hypothetical protein
MVEELRPEDLEELVQEFEEEDGVQESLPQEVEELLRVLQSGSLYLARQNAADQLGKVGTSSSRIIRVLAAAQASDAYPEVRRAAAKALRAPVHQAYVQQHPELQETAQRAIEKVPSSDSLDEDTRARLMRPAKRYDRKKPVGSGSTLLWILAGMFFLGLGILSWRESSGWIFVLLGVVIIALALRSWLAPSSARGMLRRATKETVGMVDRLQKVKGDDDYGPKYKYFVTVRFEADEPETGTRVIALTARVARHIWKGMEIGGTVGIRYAAEDPRIALIGGEW